MTATYLPFIQYIALLGQRDEPRFINVPQESVTHPLLGLIGCLPQSMSQFIYGIEYYEWLKRYNLHGGYKMVMVYPDCSKEETDWLLDMSGCPHVLLLCTEDETAIGKYAERFEGKLDENYVCLAPAEAVGTCRLSCTTVTDTDALWRWFYEYANRNYAIDEKRMPFSVPYMEGDVYDNGNVFSPTRTNTQTINSILGNWGFPKLLSDEEVSKERKMSSEAAMGNRDGFDRQRLLVGQIHKIRALENGVAAIMPGMKRPEEQYRSPLFIAAPYTSIEMRKFADRAVLAENKNLARLAEKIMGFHYTHNYTIVYPDSSFPAEHAPAIEYIIRNCLVPRNAFFDFVAQLHCSAKFSPYLRLPMMGKNINSELAFVGIKHLDRLANSPSKNKSIRKVMEKIGKKMADETLSPQAAEMLKQYAAQVVAMTDLPIEWLAVDGVPLGFTHDVCRLPETPVTGLLAQYMESQYRPYTVPEDILQKTLVVFGNEDPDFVRLQHPVRELSGKLGFKIRTCLDKASFFSTVEELNPDLLIIDTHGDVDESTHQSFIRMGKDEVNGDDIIKSGIRPRLVFLSACNTFTAYNTVSTIANAFFQTGANAVTTSYMPLQIMPATVLYIRLLRNLDEAAHKKIHVNWLAFISHLMRTSYIYAPLEYLYRKNLPVEKGDLERMSSISLQSMIFGNRRKIYEKLNDRAYTKELKCNYESVIPHYLMYSTLGRADMVRFESYMEMPAAEDAGNLTR